MTSRFGHIYPDIGNYSLFVNVSNLVSWMEYEVWIPVQIPIKDFVVYPVKPFPLYDIPPFVFTVSAGSHIYIDAVFDGFPVENLTFNSLELMGTVFVGRSYLPDIGRYIYNVTVCNLVTSPISRYIEAWADFPLEDVQILEEKIYSIVGDSVYFNLTMKQGSRVNVTIDYDDGTDTELFYHDLVTNGTVIQFNHVFDDHALCNVSFIVDNPINKYISYHFLTIQNIFQDFIFNATSPLELLFNDTAPCNISMTFLNIGNPPPTDAYYTFFYGDAANLSESMVSFPL